MPAMDDKKILITSALPYVNNIPHLGNLIQALSADNWACAIWDRNWAFCWAMAASEV